MAQTLTLARGHGMDYPRVEPGAGACPAGYAPPPHCWPGSCLCWTARRRRRDNPPSCLESGLWRQAVDAALEALALERSSGTALLVPPVPGHSPVGLSRDSES